MSVSYKYNNNKEFTNSQPVEGRRKPTATTPPNQPVVDFDYHNNAAHAAMAKIIIITTKVQTNRIKRPLSIESFVTYKMFTGKES